MPPRAAGSAPFAPDDSLRACPVASHAEALPAIAIQAIDVALGLPMPVRRAVGGTDAPEPLAVHALLHMLGWPTPMLYSAPGYGEVGRYSALFAPAVARLRVPLAVPPVPTSRALSGADPRLGAASFSDPFAEVAGAMDRIRWDGSAAAVDPLPRFAGGWIGTLAYDVVTPLEGVATSLPPGAPLIDLSFSPGAWVHDRLKNRWYTYRLRGTRAPASHSGHAGSAHHLDARDADGVRDDEGVGGVEATPLPDPFAPVLAALSAWDPEALRERLAAVERCAEDDGVEWLAGPLSSDFNRSAYETTVGAALDYIAAGDIYQVNLAQRFRGRIAPPVSDPILWRAALTVRLLRRCPAPFAATLWDGAAGVISTSPERFLRVTADPDGATEGETDQDEGMGLRGGRWGNAPRRVETWPIKGTRPRGATPAEDEALLADLEACAKERAELAMITDLLRNDLGRVCAYGTVRVVEARRLETFANVHHARSGVVGDLRPGVGVADLLRATMPGGSVTGAPKIRACQIIAEQERAPRGLYCGAIGWLGLDGALDLNIAIRTVMIDRRAVAFHVGGGIVADSDPGREYDETLHKAAGIRAALNATLDANAAQCCPRAISE